MQKKYLIKMLVLVKILLITFILRKLIAIQEISLSGFQITLLPVKEYLYLGEPLRLFIIVKKVGEDTFWGALDLRSRVLIEVKKKEDTVVKVFKGSEVDPYQYGRVCEPFPILAPFETWKGFPYRPGFQKVDEKIIFYYFREIGEKGKPEEGLVFDTPGTYQIRVFIEATQAQPKLDFKIFASNPTQITILEPTANDLEAMKLWVGKEQAEMFFGIYLVLDKYKENISIILKKLVNNYPNSIYRPYAIFALAGGLGDWMLKSSQEVALIEQLVQEYPDFLFLDKALLDLYNYYLYERKDLKNAKNSLERLKKFLYLERIPGLKEKIKDIDKSLKIINNNE